MINIYFLIVLAALLLEFALETTASLLNLKTLRFEPPPSLRDIYNPEEYRKSQEYTRVNTRFGFVTSSFRLVILLAFWFTGGFNYLDTLVQGWGSGPVISGLLYFGILMFAYSLITFPFSIYDTFVIEQRFGFNRTTPGLFISDRLKGLALSVLLGAPLLAAVLALFQYAGTFAWVYVWLATIIFEIALQYVVPTWIMPLCNKFTPLGEGELRDAIMSYANSVGYHVSRIFVIDSSKRSTKSNAFFIGFGRSKRIALFDTLVAKHTVPELVGVLAHEVGHAKLRHTLQNTVIGILHAGLILFLLSFFIHEPSLYRAFFMERTPLYAGLLFFGLLYTPLDLLLSIGMQLLSRRNERAADLFAARTTSNPGALAAALKKLSAGNLSNLTPHPFYVFLAYSHPPLLQRLNTLNQYEESTKASRQSPA